MLNIIQQEYRYNLEHTAAFVVVSHTAVKSFYGTCALREKIWSKYLSFLGVQYTTSVQQY